MANAYQEALDAVTAAENKVKGTLVMYLLDTSIAQLVEQKIICNY